MTPSTPIYIETVWWVFKVAIVILALMYFLFTLVVLRQVKLMTETLITEVAPGIRALSVFYTVLALGVIGLLVWLLF